MPKQDSERSGMCVLGMSRLRTSKIDNKKRCSISFEFQLCVRFNTNERYGAELTMRTEPVNIITITGSIPLLVEY